MKKLDLVNGEKKIADFLGVEADAYSLLNELIKNKELCKLLYFDTPDALEKAMSEEECAKLIDDQYINIKPIFPEDEVVKNFIMISFDNFSKTDNPYFMDYTIEITIFCHSDNLDFKKDGVTHIRDLYISHLLLESLNELKINGVGKLSFSGAQSVILGSSTKYSGRSLVFTNMHNVSHKEKSVLDNRGDGFE